MACFTPEFQLEASLQESAARIAQERREREESEQLRRDQEEQRLHELEQQAEEFHSVIETERVLREKSERLAQQLQQQAVCKFLKVLCGSMILFFFLGCRTRANRSRASCYGA